MKYIVFCLFFALGGCSQDYETLENSVGSIKSLEPLAKIMLESDKLAMIDLRENELRIEPEIMNKKITQGWLNTLKQLEVPLVHTSSTMGGVLFMKEVRGLSISGSASGWIYFSGKNSDATFVDDIEQYMNNLPKDVDVDRIEVIQRLDDQWGVFVKSF
jgi:hypothetical protein